MDLGKQELANGKHCSTSVSGYRSHQQVLYFISDYIASVFVKRNLQKSLWDSLITVIEHRVIG